MDQSNRHSWMHAKYAHIRIPKALLNINHFPNLSPEAILLYGAMMDRTSLSIRFGGKRFISQANEVTIIFTQKEIMQLLRCKRDKARSVTRELINSKLINVNRTCKRGPYIITVIPQEWSTFDSKMKKADIISPPPMLDNPLLTDGKTGIFNNDNIGLNNTDHNNPNISKHANQHIIHWEDSSDYEQLITVYGSASVNRVLDVLQGLFSFPPDTICILGSEMDWCLVEPLFCTLSASDFEFVLQKMKKAIYTKEYSDAFIIDAIYSAVIIHA